MKKVNIFACMTTALLAITGVLSADDSGKSAIQSINYRGSYYVNGEIHVNTYGATESKPLTSGHQDFKPSWSKTGDMLVFFRRLKNDPVVTNWKTAILAGRRMKKAIVYHASPSLYLYTIADENTVKVSTNDGADYRYPHCEATPK